jgi:hypothetical protein
MSPAGSRGNVVLPPVLAAPGQHAVTAQVAVDPPIGVADLSRRQVTTLALEPGTMICLYPGTMICLYTDGLGERRPSGSALAAVSLTISSPPPHCRSG